MSTHAVKILWQNHLNRASLIAHPPGEATLPIKNILYMRRSKVFRSVSVDVQILFNFVNAKTCNAAVISQHNLTRYSTVRLQLYDAGEQAGNVIYDNIVTNSADDIDIVFQFNELAAVSGRFIITDMNNPDGYIELGRAIVANAWQSHFNVSWGLGYQSLDTTIFTTSELGSRFPRSGTRHKEVLGINFEHLTREERNALSVIFDDIGLRGDAYWIFYPHQSDKVADDLRGFFMFKSVVPELEHRYVGGFGCTLDLIESNGVSVNDDTRTLINREVVEAGEAEPCKEYCREHAAEICTTYINEHISTICEPYCAINNPDSQQVMFLAHKALFPVLEQQTAFSPRIPVHLHPQNEFATGFIFMTRPLFAVVEQDSAFTTLQRPILYQIPEQENAFLSKTF